MSVTKDLLPQQPEEPLPEDCCGNGCNPCVLDVYQDLLQKWKNDCNNIKESHGAASNNSVNVLSMTRYMPFQVLSIEKLTHDTNIYRFQAVILTDPSEKTLPENKNLGEIKISVGKIMVIPGQHLMLRNSYKGETKEAVNEEILTRAYTPISITADHGKGKFDVMIKIYDKGKMSCFVNKLQEGDVTFWRGPYGSFKYERNSFPSILMLCAGTGVAPMYSVANMIVNDEQDETLIRMVFACKSFEDILLRNEIRKLSSFWNFHAEIFLSNNNSGTPRYGETVKFGRIEEIVVQSEVDRLGKKCLVLICGPSPFTDSMAQMVRTCGVLEEQVYIF